MLDITLRRVPRKRLLPAALALIALSPGPSALAADAKEKREGPEEIVVTGARNELELYVPKETRTGAKTEVALQDIPAAVVVIPDAVLTNQGVVSMNDALTNVSAVAPKFGGGYGLADNYVIRGLDMRFLRDGAPDGPSFMGYRRTLADVQSIDVLKGPGSALYGRGEPGGSVNIATKPALEDRSAEFELSAGRFDFWDVTGDVGGTLREELSGRLISHYERSDGFRGLERQMFEALPTLSLELGEVHHLTLDYDYRDGRVVVDNYGIPFTTDRELADVDTGSRFYSAFNEVEQTIHRISLRDEAQLFDTFGVRAELIYDRRDVDVIRNAGGGTVNAAGVMGGRNGRRQRDNADYWTAQLESVWTPSTGPIEHTLLGGFEYARTDVDTLRRNYSLPSITIVDGHAEATETEAVLATSTLGFDREITSDVWSVYAQEQMDFADVVKLRAGVRFDQVDLRDQGLGASAPIDVSNQEGLVSWQVGAVYEPIDPLSLYAGYARGKFVSIQTESTSLTGVPERSNQIELGAKSVLFGGRLNANLALFETERDHYFVTLTPAVDPVPEGKMRSRGVELDLIGAPLAGLTVNANFAYVDAINRSASLVTVSGIATNQSAQGKRLQATPETSASLWANYTLQTGPLAGLGFGAGVTYKGASNVDALELLEVPDYTLLRVALSYRTERFDAQLTVNNLTDEKYFSVPTFIGALPGDPRNVQVTLRARF